MLVTLVRLVIYGGWDRQNTVAIYASHRQFTKQRLTWKHIDNLKTHQKFFKRKGNYMFEAEYLLLIGQI